MDLSSCPVKSNPLACPQTVLASLPFIHMPRPGLALRWQAQSALQCTFPATVGMGTFKKGHIVTAYTIHTLIGPPSGLLGVVGVKSNILSGLRLSTVPLPIGLRIVTWLVTAWVHQFPGVPYMEDDRLLSVVNLPPRRVHIVTLGWKPRRA